MSDPKAEIDQLNQSFERLRIEFERFFRKERRTPPLQERNLLEATLRRMGARPMVATSDQFRLTGIQSRFYAMSGLWERQLRDLETGRAQGGAGTAPPAAAAPAEPVAELQLDRTVEVWKTARMECGIPVSDQESAAFREMLRKKAAEIAGNGGGQVEFSVSIEGGKPKIRAALRRDD